MQRASCSFINVRQLDTDYAEESASALFVVGTARKEYSVLCRGQPESRASLTTEMYLIFVDGDCQIKGQDWTLQRELLLNSPLLY